MYVYIYINIRMRLSYLIPFDLKLALIFQGSNHTEWWLVPNLHSNSSKVVHLLHAHDLSDG